MIVEFVAMVSVVFHKTKMIHYSGYPIGSMLK